MLRKAILVLGLVPSICALTLSIASEAQQPAKVYRVGWLSSAATTGGTLDTLKKELRDLGYVEGQNLIIDVRGAEGKSERLPALASWLSPQRGRAQ